MSKLIDKTKESTSDDGDTKKLSTKKSPGRGRARGRGRRTKSTPRKNSQKKGDLDLFNEQENDIDNDTEVNPVKETANEGKLIETEIKLESNLKIDTEFDIESLPSFISTSSSAFNTGTQIWNNRVNLIGQKCQNITIHSCDKCNEYIFIYGRLIPCKHAFCISCANKHEGNCFICNERIMNIEKCSLATLFICSTENCKRTYLSERDLLAHINHRHTNKRSQVTLPSSSSTNRNSYEYKSEHSKAISSQLNSSNSSFLNKLLKPNSAGSSSFGSSFGQRPNVNTLIKSANRNQMNTATRSHHNHH